MILHTFENKPTPCATNLTSMCCYDNRVCPCNAAVVVAGRPATGKTTALNTVVSTLNAIQGSDSSSIKLAKVYPDTYEDLSDIYGCVSPTGRDWVDGIFTSIFRKAHKVGHFSYDGNTLL